MGTNYYLKLKDHPLVKTKNSLLHMGKSSAGWHFLLKIYPPHINSFEDWKKVYNSKEYEIINEYDEIISWKEMEDIITNRKQHEFIESDSEEVFERKLLTAQNRLGRHLGVEKMYESYEDMLEQNNAVRGLNGLWARKDSKNFKIIRTDGTYDLTPDKFL